MAVDSTESMLEAPISKKRNFINVITTKLRPKSKSKSNSESPSGSLSGFKFGSFEKFSSFEKWRKPKESKVPEGPECPKLPIVDEGPEWRNSHQNSDTSPAVYYQLQRFPPFDYQSPYHFYNDIGSDNGIIPHFRYEESFDTSLSSDDDQIYPDEDVNISPLDDLFSSDTESNDIEPFLLLTYDDEDVNSLDALLSSDFPSWMEEDTSSFICSSSSFGLPIKNNVPRMTFHSHTFRTFY